MKCVICDKGNLVKKTIREEMFGTYLGMYPALVCTSCGESYTDSKTTAAIEKAAKAKGIWGLGRKTKITRSGNSLAVRLPKEIVKFLNLKEGKEAYIHPEGGKIVIESKD